MKKWLLIALLCITPVYAAPLPKKTVNKPAPVKKIDISGDWLMTWGGSDWHVHFDKNGSYACTSVDSNDPWAGSYGYDPMTRTLVVQEKRIDDNSNSYLTWTVTLDASLTGITQSGTNVRLNKPSK